MHNYKYEAGGVAVLGSIQPQPILAAEEGTLPLDLVVAAIKAGRYSLRAHPPDQFGKYHHSKVLPLDYLARAFEFSR